MTLTLKQIFSQHFGCYLIIHVVKKFNSLILKYMDRFLSVQWWTGGVILITLEDPNPFYYSSITKNLNEGK